MSRSKHPLSILLLALLLSYAGPLAALFQVESLALETPPVEGENLSLAEGPHALQLKLDEGYYALSCEPGKARGERRFQVYASRERCVSEGLRLGCHHVWLPLLTLAVGADNSGSGITAQRDPMFLVVAERQAVDAEGNTVWVQSKLVNTRYDQPSGASQPTRILAEFEDGEGGMDLLKIHGALD